MTTAAMYLRVSTRDQTTDNQRIELERVAVAKGWSITGVYEDDGISGAKGRDKRPQYDRMLKDATRARFDVVMAWDVSRLGRSLSGLIHALDDLNAHHVGLYLHQQAIDTTSPSGRALFQMCGVFAEFERSMISERVKSGLNRARASGRQLGRPRVAVVVAPEHLHLSIRELARIWGVSVGTAQKIKKSWEAKDGTTRRFVSS